MQFKKRMQQGISMALVTALSFSNAVIAGGAEPAATSANEVEVSTSTYQAQANLSTGSLTFQNNAHTASGWNNIQKAMVPGATMLMGQDGISRGAALTGSTYLNSHTVSGGGAGMELEGELSGVKSWFFFDDEILCLGADIKNSGSTQDKVIQVVDNVLVSPDTKASLTNPANGYRNILQASKEENPKYSWKPIVDTIVQGQHSRNWLTASSLPNSQGKPLEWGYIFGSSITDSHISYRFPAGGTETVQNFELWLEPTDGAYQYTLAAGGNQSEFANNLPAETENKVLSNTRELQAAENPSEHTLMVNKWGGGESTLPNSLATITLKHPAAVVVQQDPVNNSTTITVAKPSKDSAPVIELALDLQADKVEEIGQAGALTAASTEGGKIELTLDTSKMQDTVSIKTTAQSIDQATGDSIQLVRGQKVLIPTPVEFEGQVTWSTKFLKNDGSFLRNAGYQKIKRELKDGETDGTRTAGDTSASHLADLVAQGTAGALLTAKNKGDFVVVAQDSKGTTKQWKVKILFEDPAKLPAATEQDFARIRQTWIESLIGSNVENEPGGAEILQAVNDEAERYWNAYAYKGQQSCEGIPWKDDENAAGNKNIPYADDAVEFRPAYKKILAMAKAYAMEGGKLYHNAEMLQDMIHILDFLSTQCYVPKSQTDNWWTWEIGIPKDLIPALMLIYDGLMQEQVMKFTDGLYFFQPDPYHEGAIGTASTHGQGYRVAQGANIIDCSTTAVGLGALRQDGEQVYMGRMASAQTFTIHTIENSADIAKNGYKSGFYPDGSYLDHGKVPYLGSYGVEFMKGAVKIPALLAATPWSYPPQVQKNLESYVVEGFGNGIYRGMMLDCLKGRSVARPASSNRAEGRNAMSIILQMVDSFSSEAKAKTLSSLKVWLQDDPAYLDSLTGAQNIAIKQKAMEILKDSSIKPEVAPMHRSYPLMDRAFHRTDEYMFVLSMYSERIQNSEIMNHENRFGWHQSNGMTYLYDKDDQYTNNFWNTVNPLRLAGTTVAAVNIGNGKPDSSGYAQGGDFCSDQSWVGGSSIGNFGISGMAFSGVSGGIPGDGSVTYAPNLHGKKSWFMFDNEIVCLGAGITNSGMELPVETIVENKKLNEQGSNAFIVNGKTVDLPVQQANIKDLVNHTVDLSGTTLSNPQWAHLSGTKAVGTGYYFPKSPANIHARRGKTTGSWKDIGDKEGESTQNYLELWFDHGANPTDATYSYVLLPEKTPEQTQNYAQNPAVEILENTADIQAVFHKGLQMTGINFWDKQGGTVGNLSSNSAASVMVQQTTQNTLKVAVSDPTMKNMGSIQITLNQPIAGQISLDHNITMTQKDGKTVLTFQMANTNGASSLAELKLPVPQPEPTPNSDK